MEPVNTMKYLFSLIFLLVASVSGFAQTNFTAVMVDSNSVVQRPTNFFTTNRILTFDTNANVVYTNTNTLTFTNVLGFGTNSVAATRTNLGIGGGLTTNVTFVDLNTNTNSVTISNGVITGWTQ
jgi:hypothetical protein